MSGEEGPIIHALIDLCFRHKIACLIQVGSEDGYEADQIRIATGCRAVCCDPDPRIMPVSGKVEFHEVLIGGEDCITDFIIHPVQGLSSKVGRGESGEVKTLMPQYTLRKFCAKYNLEPDALLIDTEGTSLDVLQGCGALLDGIRLIYCEVQHDDDRGPYGKADEVEAFLTERGFKRWTEAPSYRSGGQSNYTFLRGA